jgi:hypothetical protein
MHVILVHGLGRTPLSLIRLARDLQRMGHTTELVGYIAAVERFSSIRSRVRRSLERAAHTNQPYAGVGHSLGGLLLRAALVGWPRRLLSPRLLVMLGTPHRSPRLAQRFHRSWPYRLINGQSGQLLARPRFFAALPQVRVPCTVIAGTRGWRLARPAFPGVDNDGIVALPEVEPASGASVVKLPVGHTFMMNDPRVRRLLGQLLADAEI